MDEQVTDPSAREVKKPTPFLFAIVIIALILLIFTGGYFFLRQSRGISAPKLTLTPQSDKLDLESIKKLAVSSKCAEIRNQLYYIDNKLALWGYEGNCDGDRFGYQLFEKNSTRMVCSQKDSVKGAQTSCKDETKKELFETALKNFSLPDLGLGSEHSVEQVLNEVKPIDKGTPNFGGTQDDR